MRRLRETDLDELREQAEPTAEPKPAEKADTPAARALELQRTAGNRAVGAALARWPMWFPQATAQWPKEPEVIVDGVTMPLLSFSWGEARGGAGGGAHGPGKAQHGDMHFTTRLSKHSVELWPKVSRAEPIKTMVIVMPSGDRGYTITFKDVLLTSLSSSTDADSFSAAFATYEMGTSPPRR